MERVAWPPLLSYPLASLAEVGYASVGSAGEPPVLLEPEVELAMRLCSLPLVLAALALSLCCPSFLEDIVDQLKSRRLNKQE